MPLYEHVVLARQDLSNQQAEAVVDNMKEILEQNGGTVPFTESWGLKTLSYRIQRNRKAHMTFINIDAPHAAVAEMERQMRLNEDILRFMTIRVKEHEEGPTAMMIKRDRDDRRGGRGHRDR
ncbi:MAG: 30S ribosomal protein S6 [Rhizobiales bacterium]|nr:30S ribosomal protein S6 [Hyphomicrobiales bacterium]